MNELQPILTRHNLNLTQLSCYERQMPPERRALNLAVRETLLLPGMNVSKLARFIGIDRGKVYRMFYGRDVDQLPQRWTSFEDKQIRRFYDKMTYCELAEKIQRTHDGVCGRVKALGLRKKQR